MPCSISHWLVSNSSTLYYSLTLVLFWNNSFIMFFICTLIFLYFVLQNQNTMRTTRLRKFKWSLNCTFFFLGQNVWQVTMVPVYFLSECGSPWEMSVDWLGWHAWLRNSAQIVIRSGPRLFWIAAPQWRFRDLNCCTSSGSRNLLTLVTCPTMAQYCQS